MIAQIFIFVLSAPAMWLISRTEPWRKYGYLLGLASQPFWYYATYKSEQWGILILSSLYTYSWCQGIYFNFIKKDHGNK